MKKIKIILTEDGSIATLELPVRLRKDSFNTTSMYCLVPELPELSSAAFVRFYATDNGEDGAQVWASQPYPMVFDKNAIVNNIKYRQFKASLPEEFCSVERNIYVIFALVDLDLESNEITKISPSDSLCLSIHGGGFNTSSSKLSNADVTIAHVNTLTKMAKYKVDVSEELPFGIKFTLDGYKTPLNEYLSVELQLPTLDGPLATKTGSIIAKEMVPSSSEGEENIIGFQTEFAYTDLGIYKRVNKYNISQQSLGLYTLLTAGEWEILNKSYFDKINSDLSGVNATLNKKIDDTKKELSDNCKTSEQKLDQKIDKNKEDADSKIQSTDEKFTKVTDQQTKDINNLYNLVNTGENYLGEYPSQDVLPTDAEIKTYVKKKTGRDSQRGDQLDFILNVPEGVDIAYKLKYVDFENEWKATTIPGASPAQNDNMGLITGTNTIQAQELLSQGIVKMLLDISNGIIRDIKVFDSNISKIVSLVSQAVLYDDGNIKADNLYGKDEQGIAHYVGLDGDSIVVGDTARITVIKGKNKKVVYSWIDDDGRIKTETLALDSEIGDVSKLSGQTLVDYCISKYNELKSDNESLDKKIDKVASDNATAVKNAKDEAASNLTNSVNTLNENITQNKELAEQSINEVKQSVSAEAERAQTVEEELGSQKLDKININEDYLKDLVFVLNGDTAVAELTVKNPVSGDSRAFEITISGAASEDNAGLMTQEMVRALNKTVSDIESLKYIGRQIKIFNTYADAQLFDWDEVSLNLNDYFVVKTDESRELEDEKDKTTKYILVSQEEPITTEKNFTFAGLITTVIIQVATTTEVGGILSKNINGYIYVEADGSAKLVGYDEIISTIGNLTSQLNSEIARAKAAEEANAQAIATEHDRAVAAELKLTNEKANRNELPTKTSQLENDGEGGDVPDPYAHKSEIPTKTSQLENNSNFATTNQLPTKNSQLQNDSDYAPRNELPTKTSQLENDGGGDENGIFISQKTFEAFKELINALIPSGASGTNQLADKKYVSKSISDLVGSAPETLDTLTEIATALQNNPDVITDLLKAVGERVKTSEYNDKVSELNDLISKKQASLNFDSTPTSGSSNPVTSDGIKKAIPTNLSGLGEDESHRTVSDTEKTNWNGKIDKAAFVLDGTTLKITL